MIQLRAIGEHHPELIINNLFSELVRSNPVFILFWNEMYKQFLKSTPEELQLLTRTPQLGPRVLRAIEGDYKQLLPQKLYQRLTEVAQAVLLYAENTYQQEMRALEEGDYKTFFSEGNSDRAIDVFARKKGVSVVKLDVMDLRGHYFDDSSFYEFNKQRELTWVSGIEAANVEIEKALLLAGNDHLEGRFGLPELLVQKNIQLMRLPFVDVQKGKEVEQRLEELSRRIEQFRVGVYL